MSEKPDVSRIIRERAMAILRDTRAKIDPALLAAMKERLSPAPVPAAQPAQPETEAVDKQKIAQIVMLYMKNREDTQKH